jgi:hypothetical protein
MRRAHQPGSQPIDIPEVIPNPAVVPKPEPTPREPAPKEPVKIPEKVPAGIVLPESSLAAANQCPRAHRGRRPSHFAQRHFSEEFDRRGPSDSWMFRVQRNANRRNRNSAFGEL